MLHEKGSNDEKELIALAKDDIKIKLKGHESFYIREGWLTKGIKNVADNPRVFINSDATEVLGVGSNMVKSIRYWLKAAGLAEEKKCEGGKWQQFLTPDFGEFIREGDPYFEDIFSLWLVHYKIASNSHLATAWYLFFNEILIKEFSKEDIKSEMMYALNRFTNNANFSEKSLLDDCDCIIKTYYTEKKEEINPEDNKICPLSALGLLSVTKTDSNKEIILKTKPSLDKLSKLVVLYIILDNLGESNSVSIDQILNDKCNAGRILNLDRNLLNEYLDLLKKDNYLKIVRTAGLDQVYITCDIKKEGIIEKYYRQLKE